MHHSIPASYRKIHVVNTSALSFAEQAEIVEVAIEQPGPGQALVKVEFAGIEASDILQNAGVYGLLASAAPEVEVNGKVQLGDCGCEGVGTIVALGNGENESVGLQIGMPVLITGFGIGFREYVTCPTAQLVPLPMPASAAMTAIPISAATAACALEISGHMKMGEKVLVTGAAGGGNQGQVPGWH